MKINRDNKHCRIMMEKEKNKEEPFLKSTKTDRDLLPDLLHLNTCESEQLCCDTGLLQNERPEWTSSWEFLFSCMSFSVGLGSLWRFPFTAIANGGGTFLIVYLILVCLVGYPIYFLELAVGQFCSGGPVQIWNLAPIFKGVGYISVATLFLLTSYYCVVMSVCVHYFFTSFNSPLVWTVCQNVGVNGTCRDNPTELYYKNSVVKEIPDILNGIGAPDPTRALCLLGFWLIMLGTMSRGIKSSGKVAYITCTLPIAILLIFLVQSLILPGSLEGILYFVTPEWTAMLEPEMWFSAVGQLFFSMSLSHGPIVMYGSLNKFKHNVSRDAMLVCGFHFLISLIAGLTTFSVIGCLAHQLNVPNIHILTEGGFTLAFQTFPLFISKLTWAPQLFAILFFLMLIVLGLGNGMSVVSILIFLQEKLPNAKRSWVTTIFCLVSFLFGLPYITPGGQLVMQLVDNHTGLLIQIVGALEVMGICWCYGARNFVRDVEFMLQKKVSTFVKICWLVIVPVTLSILLARTIFTWSPPDNNYYPPSATYWAWNFTGVGILILILAAVHAVLSSENEGEGLIEKFLTATRPSRRWGPRRNMDWRVWEQTSVA